MMKKFFIISFLMLIAVELNAQCILVVDNEGEPIPFVTVTTPEGKYITSTDMDGWINNIGNHNTIFLSQIAYKPLTIDVADIKGGKIILEDATYDLPEVVVKPKELIYCQTYFRDIYIDDEGPIYFRGGVIDNQYNIAKKDVSAKTRHLSKGESSFLRFILDRFSGQYDKFARLPEKSYYERLLSAQKKGIITLTDVGNGRQIISDSICQLGNIYWDADERTRTVTFDIGTYNNHLDNKEQQEKAAKKGKTFVPDTVAQNRSTRTLFQVYRTDSIGNSRVDDFVMSQYTNIGRHKRSGKEYIIQVQSYATDFAYIDKKEFKQLRKDNKVDMSIQELRQFEKNNKIPPLAPNIQEQIDILFEKDLKN